MQKKMYTHDSQNNMLNDADGMMFPKRCVSTYQYHAEKQ